ncbi:MAG: hypothetical protein ACT4P2_07755 [Pseudomonadota bacterium]
MKFAEGIAESGRRAVLEGLAWLWVVAVMIAYLYQFKPIFEILVAR